MMHLENYDFTAGEMIHITGIPPLRAVSFLEGIDKVGGVGDLPSVLKKWIECSLGETVRNRLRACGIKLGAEPIKNSWWLGLLKAI